MDRLKDIDDWFIEACKRNPKNAWRAIQGFAVLALLIWVF